MNSEHLNHRLLIISNNVMSSTRSNGKVILSYFDCLPQSMVRQLYFSSELPSVKGYIYFQISDADVIKGLFKKSNRGRIINKADDNNYKLYKSNPNAIKKTIFRLMREVLWAGKRWKSDNLIHWLDDYQPTDIFFVGGDCIFAYTICNYIVKRYNSRLSMYLTDDYILPRKTDNLIAAFRRRLIKNALSNTLTHTCEFFTISKPMKETYKEFLGRDSFIVTNMSEQLRNEKIEENYSQTTILYAGSLYYGRSNVLNLLANVIQDYNSTAKKRAKLNIYTNVAPSENELAAISVPGASEYCGNLTKEKLVIEMNRCHILCIVESFDKRQVENTRLSLSTKVPEYMSVGKPILAIGPDNIGTIEYLSDIAACATKKSQIREIVFRLLDSKSLQEEYGNRAYEKYLKYHVKEATQAQFIAKVLGEEIVSNEDIVCDN